MVSKLDREVIAYIEEVWRAEFPGQDVTLGKVAARATRLAMMAQKVELANRVLVLCSDTTRMFWSGFEVDDLVFN